MISGRCRRFLWAKSVSHSFPHGVEKQGFQPAPFILAVSSALFSHVLPQIPRAGFARVEVARGVYHDAFGRAGRLLHGAKGRDKDGDLAVLDAADANARPDARVILRVRLMIGYVKDIVAVDVDPARPAELLPLCEKFAILVEDLDAIVAAVADEDLSLRIDSDGMRRVELAGARAFPAPRFDERPILRELHDARVGVPAMPIGDESIAVRSRHDVARPIERVRPVAGNPGLAERHQHLSFRVELEYLVALAVFAGRVSRPDVAVPVDVETMRLIEYALAEHLQDLARRIELDDGREVRSLTSGSAAPLERPDIAVAVNIDPDGRAPLPAFGELGPALFDTIRIVLRVCLRCEHRNRDNGRDEQKDHSICMAHDSDLPGIIVIACRYFGAAIISRAASLIAILYGVYIKIFVNVVFRYCPRGARWLS